MTDASFFELMTRIEFMTRNEADIAFKRRVETIFEWIAPTLIPESKTSPMPDAEPKALILDIPCGRGFYLKMFSHAGVSRVVGADADRGVLQRAANALGEGAAAALHQTDVCRLPYRDDTFAAAVFSEGLEHVDDDLAALREVYRVVKPGGVVAITVPNADYPFWWDPINRSLDTLFGLKIRRGPLAGIWANHVRLYSAHGLRRAVESAGFVVEESRSFTHHCFPFSHNLIYGLGKPLLDSGLLPDSISRVADRSRFDQRSGRFNPLRLALAVFTFSDRWNARDEPEGRSTVSLAVQCRKPVNAPPGVAGDKE